MFFAGERNQWETASAAAAAVPILFLLPIVNKEVGPKSMNGREWQSLIFNHLFSFLALGLVCVTWHDLSRKKQKPDDDDDDQIRLKINDNKNLAQKLDIAVVPLTVF